MFRRPLPGWTEDPATTALRLRSFGGLAWLDDASGGRSYLGCAPDRVVGGTRWQQALGPMELFRPEEPAVPWWIGYVAYDHTTWFGRYDALLEWATEDGRSSVHLVGESEAAMDALAERLRSEPRPATARLGPLCDPDPIDHTMGVDAVKHHIAAGDVYQVNLARAWRADFEGDALHLYLAMRRASPVPRGVFLDAGPCGVCALTMERFLEWHPDGVGRGVVRSSPIKGTIARASNQGVAEDASGAETLRADPKEHAEHSMIVDLVRNDLGRVAEIGSVHVEALLEVESYAKLQHLVSTVRATTRETTSLTSLLDATFPPGSVTGAPKVSAMKIIDALEPEPRGIYCGAVGHVDRRGGIDFAVAIRTAVVRDGQVVYHAGGGLVWASDAARELAETELKARVFLDAAAEMRSSERDEDTAVRP